VGILQREAAQDGKIEIRLRIQIQDEKAIDIFTDRFVNRPADAVPAWDKRS